MNFVSLSEFLHGEPSVAAAFAAFAADDDDATRAKEYSRYVASLSEFAADFHARLHNASEPPRWVELDPETKRALYNEAVADEAMAILKHKAGQSRRDAAEYSRHIVACVGCGLDPETVPQAYSLADFRKFPFLRESQIGFARDELSTFLEPVEVEEKQGPNLTGIQAQQVMRIRKIIEELGYDLKCLPPNPPGKRGIKAAVRDEYKNRFPDYTVCKFDRAWERMLAE
jgi:hypothetical protein